MTWDVPTAEDCPESGQTLFNRAGKGRMKPFCDNEHCSRVLPEDQRGYYKKKTTQEGAEGEPAGEPAGQSPKSAAGEKATGKKTAAKKSTAKKATAKKNTEKKPAAKKTAKKSGEV